MRCAKGQSVLTGVPVFRNQAPLQQLCVVNSNIQIQIHTENKPVPTESNKQPELQQSELELELIQTHIAYDTKAIAVGSHPGPISLLTRKESKERKSSTPRNLHAAFDITQKHQPWVGYTEPRAGPHKINPGALAFPGLQGPLNSPMILQHLLRKSHHGQ